MTFQLEPGDLLDLVDESEVATLFGTTRLGMKSRRRRGTAPPAIRVGGRQPWKYPRRGLAEWLSERPISEAGIAVLPATTPDSETSTGPDAAAA